MGLCWNIQGVSCGPVLEHTGGQLWACVGTYRGSVVGLCWNIQGGQLWACVGK